MLSRLALRPYLRLLLAAIITGLLPPGTRPPLTSAVAPNMQLGPVASSIGLAQPATAPLASVPQPDVTPASKPAAAPIRSLQATSPSLEVLMPTHSIAPGGVFRYVDGTWTLKSNGLPLGQDTEWRGVVADPLNRGRWILWSAGKAYITTDALDHAVEQMTYDQYTVDGKLIEQILFDGQQRQFAYLADTTVLTTTGVDGRQTVAQYDYAVDNTLAGVTVNDQAVTAAAFDDTYRPGVVADGSGNLTWTTSLTNGLPIAQTNALGQITRAEYDAQNRPLLVTDTLGIATEYQYDGLGNLIRTTAGITTSSALRATTLYTYSYDVRFVGDSLLTDQRGPDGVVTHYIYDARGQITAATVGYGTSLAQTTAYEYDALGRRTATTVGGGTPLARTDRTSYNADNTVASTTQNEKDGSFDPAHPDEDVITSYGYDLLGRRIWTRDALGHYDVTHYDAQGQLDWTARNLSGYSGGALPATPPAYSAAQTDANVATFYGYDGLGRSTLVTETGILSGAFNRSTLQFSTATSRVTRTEYDELSRPVTVTLNYQPGALTSADTNVQTLTYYDGNSNPIWQRDALGRWTRTDYDALSRPITTTVNYEDGDPLSGARDADIVTVTHYDTAGRVDQQIDNWVDGIFNATEPITDRVTLAQYDTLGRTTSTTLNAASGQSGADLNRTRTTAYDAATGRVLGQQDALGRWTSRQYDLLGRVTASIQNCTGSQAPQACRTPTSDQNVASETHYDALGRAYETVDPLGIVTHTAFDGFGRTTASTGNYVLGEPSTPITNVTTLTSYDALGRVTATTDPLNARGTRGYNGLGQTVVVTDTMGRVTKMGYDGIGTLRWMRRADGQLTLYALDGLGRTTATIVNYQNGLVETTDSADQDLVTETVYDAAGRRIETGARTTPSTAQTTRFAYDNQDHLIAVTENATTGGCVQAPCTVVTQYAYDRAGNRIAIVDANGHARRFAYDAADQTTASIDALGHTTGWDYDTGGRVTSQRDPRGDASTPRSTGFDLTYGYDGLDRLTGTTAGDAGQLSPISAQYDVLGRRTALSDGSGTTSFQYDPLGRITRVQAPSTGTVGYGYDARGARTSLTYPDGTALQYGYWPDGQLRVVTGTTTLASYSYDTVGRLQSVARANGATTSYAYDGADRLADLATVVGTTPVSDFAYQTDRLGQRTGVTETLALPSPAVVPVVDALNDFGTMLDHSANLGFDTSNASDFGGDSSRLRRETTEGAWAVWRLDGMDAFTAVSYHAAWEPLGQFSYLASPDNSSYTPITPTVTTTPGAWLRVADDLRLPAGTNYVKVVFPTTSSAFWNPQLSQVAYRRPASAASRAISYSYDGLQRLTGAAESPGTTYGYAYDDAGNRTGVWVNGTRTVTQTYNAANQVDGWSYDAAGNLIDDGTTYSYDALGRMTQRGSTSYSYNGDGVLVYDGSTRYTQDLAAPLSQILQTTQGSATTNYLYGLDRLVAVAGSTRIWYGADALGSVRQTLDDAGAPLGGVNYDPWGTVESGSVPTFGFTGELQDAGTGLVNLRARWYSTGNGTFTAFRWRTSESSDTTPYSHHPYAYALGNPVLWTDPSGRCPWWLTAACDATGLDPDTWQHTPEYIKGIYGLDRNASDLDVAGALAAKPYESFNASIQMVAGGVNLAIDARARATLAHNLTPAVLGHAITQPWLDYYQGLQCRDAYLIGV